MCPFVCLSVQVEKLTLEKYFCLLTMKFRPADIKNVTKTQTTAAHWAVRNRLVLK